MPWVILGVHRLIVGAGDGAEPGIGPCPRFICDSAPQVFSADPAPGDGVGCGAPGDLPV